MLPFFPLLVVSLAACSDDAPAPARATPTSHTDASVPGSGGYDDGPDASAPGSDAGAPDDGAATTDDAGADAAGSDAGPKGDAGGGDGGSGARDYGTDRTKFFGASRCGSAHVQLCEDFESGAIDKGTWQVVGDAPTVDGVHVARGLKALHVTKTGNGLSYIKETKTFPAANNTYYGRAFVYFTALPTSPGMPYAHWTFIAASGTGTTGEIRLSGQLQNGLNHFGVGTDSGNDPAGTGDWTNSDNDPNGKPSAVPLNQWVCIEWLHAGKTNETRFWWDATEHTSLATTATQHGGNKNPYVLPTFTNVWIGWQEYQQSTEPFELWVDEIAIDKERIGCVL